MGKKFSELERTSSLNNGDLFAVAQVDAQAQTGYKSKSTETSAVAQKLLKGIEFPTDLQTDDKTVLGSINEVNSRTIAYDIVSGSIANFKTSLELPIKSLEIDVNATQSEGTPSLASPLPISGWSEIKTVHTWKNLLTNNKQQRTTYSVYIGTDNVNNPVFLKAGTYALNVTANISGLTAYLSGNNTPQRSIGSSFPIIFTIDKDDYFLFWVYKNEEITVDNIVSFQLELGSTATEYEPFNGNTVIINLGGTYYGGKLTQDIDGHRQFIVTHNYVLLNNESLWKSTTGTVTYFYDYAFTDRKRFGTSTEGVICSAYPIGTLNGFARWQSASGYRFGINDSTVTLDDIKASARNNDIAIVYEVDNPFIIDLPDGEPIITHNGTNNIYADSGDASVEYALTIEEYINKKIAEVQALILNS